MQAFDALHDVVRALRAPDGCAWDRAQTTASLARHLLQEAYEVVEAIEQGDDAETCRELGDLVFVALLVAATASDRGAFTIDDALTAATTKLRRRHPHVFDGAPEPSDWTELKRAEGRASVVDGVPRAMPALLRAREITARAASVGFDWPDLSGPRAKLDEEVAELDAALTEGDPAATARELGDVLFTVVNVARFLPTDPEAALHGATTRFERRFRCVEQLCLDAGGAVTTTDPATLDQLWRRAKETVG